MALTKVSPSLFQVSNNITSTTVGGSANTISLTFDSNGVITGASNNALSVANTLITGNIISSQIAPDQTLNGNLTVSGTGFLKLPSGTTAQRPTSNSSGYVRFNTTLGYPEWYDATSGTWYSFTSAGTYSVDYLVVAGGGAGGGLGGGGAGGYRTGTGLTVSANQTYTVVIGAGGGSNANGSNSGIWSSGATPFSALWSDGGGAGGGDPTGTGDDPILIIPLGII